jgi:cAMP-dependent protein kinase regulator
MTLENDFSFSQTDEYTQLLTELHNQYCQDQPEDVLQYCANFFNQKLQHERHLLLNHQTGKVAKSLPLE